MISFLADSLQIRTRKSDNALIVTFETGEYQIDEISELMKLLKDLRAYKITVEVIDE